MSITDDQEATALQAAVKHKANLILSLAAAAAARKARGADTFGIEQSLEMEDATRAGYQRALDNRLRELAPAPVAKIALGRGPR